MDWTQQTLSRLLNPGLLPLLAGAVLVYGSEKIAGKLKTADPEKTSLTLKLIGGALAILGAGLIIWTT